MKTIIMKKNLLIALTLAFLSCSSNEENPPTEIDSGFDFLTFFYG